MWLPWLRRSSSRVQNRSASLPPSPSPSPSPSSRHHISPNLTFQFHSFRDVPSLLGEDDFTRPPHSPLHRTFSSIPSSPAAALLRRRTRFIRACTAALSAARRLGLSLPPDAQNRIVVYYTSLRVVRRTFDDCQTVRSILRGFRVKMDERDVSMDSSFLAELQRIGGTECESQSKGQGDSARRRRRGGCGSEADDRASPSPSLSLYRGCLSTENLLVGQRRSEPSTKEGN